MRTIEPGEAEGQSQMAALASVAHVEGGILLVNRFIIASLLSLPVVVLADTPGKVQPDPATVCGETFSPHELCFETPKDGVARAEALSEHFYVVILKTAERCSIPEEERLQVQALFPRSKVFSMRFQCDDDLEEDVSYTNVNDQFGFLAVYAGRTIKEARARLAEVKGTGKFAGANIRRMQARLVYP
jgi:hypothetical protein